MVLGIQIAGFLFGLFMLYYSFLSYKKREFTVKEFSFWIFAWAFFLVIALFPSILDPISKSLSFARTFDLLVITGFLFLIISVFYTYTVTRKTQKQVETIIRLIAINKKKPK